MYSICTPFFNRNQSRLITWLSVHHHLARKTRSLFRIRVGFLDIKNRLFSSWSRIEDRSLGRVPGHRRGKSRPPIWMRRPDRQAWIHLSYPAFQYDAMPAFVSNSLAVWTRRSSLLEKWERAWEKQTRYRWQERFLSITVVLRWTVSFLGRSLVQLTLSRAGERCSARQSRLNWVVLPTAEMVQANGG